MAYVGYTTNDETLMDSVGRWEGERSMVVSTTSGARPKTCLIKKERDSGIIALNRIAPISSVRVNRS
nr:aspartate 1-decarboxylase [Asticcacaulis sp. AC402]